MSERKHSPVDIELAFDLIIRALNEEGNTSSPHIQDVTQVLKKVKEELLSEAAGTTMAAEEFTLDLAVQTFGLQYASWGLKSLWKIEDNPETKGFSPTTNLGNILRKFENVAATRIDVPCTLEPILAMYAQTVDRSSKAACRTSVDLILIECIGALQGNSEMPSDDRPRIQGPYEHVKMCCEVSFCHELSPLPIGQAAAAIDHATTISGRVDYGVGIIIESRHRVPNRRFHSLLLVVEAKSKDMVDAAFPQLVVFLACLHQARKAHGRSDCSVYGFTSDGFLFTFVTITHEGLLKITRSFNISQGELDTVLGCLMYILRRSPTVTPEKTNGQKSSVNEIEDIGDDAMDITNNEFLYSPVDEDE